MALTWSEVLQAKNTEPKTPRYIGDGGGLWLRIGPVGRTKTKPAKSWVFRFRDNGKQREMGLGSIDTFNLAEARQRVAKLRQQLFDYRTGDGLDPITARRQAQLAAKRESEIARTFRQCADEYIAGRKWKNVKHAKQWPATLATYAYPKLGDQPVQSIDTPLVLAVLKPIWNTKPETASRVRQRIEAVLGYATVHGYRSSDNPARWRNHLDKVLQQKTEVRKVEHHAALPYREIGEFMAALRQQPGVAARALEFAILTAARTGEVLRARWGEFNLAERVWIVPAERVKAGKEHRVPLSDASLAVLGPAPGGAPRAASDGFVFPGARAGSPLSNMALLMTLRRMGRGDLTAHGFRSTFRDWAAERTTFPSEVAEMALAHAVGDKVEAAYRRGDMFEKRRQLADAWARYCERREGGGDVVPLRA
jgi:integrase